MGRAGVRWLRSRETRRRAGVVVETVREMGIGKGRQSASATKSGASNS